MGKYINPREGDKETWLLEHGEVLDYIPETFENEIGDKLAVCLVVNVGFTAAAIAVDQRELEAFKDLRDLRPKLWFWVPKTALTPFL